MANISSGVFLIVKDESVIRGIERGEAEIYGDNMSQVEKCFGFDTDCGESEQIQIKDEIEALADGLRNEPDSSCPPASVESREFERAGFYGLKRRSVLPGAASGNRISFRHRADHVL